MADSPMKDSDGPLGVAITLNGTAMSDTTMVQSARIIRDLGRIPSATLRIVNAGPDINDFADLGSDAFKIGTNIKIAGFWGDGRPQELFSGVIMSMRLHLNAQVGQILELTCRDKALNLQEMRTSGQHIQMTDSAVMSALIHDAGLKADVDAFGDVADQVFVGASVWQMIQLLADRNGRLIDLYDGEVRTVAPNTKANPKLTVSFGKDMIEFDAQINAQRMIGSATYAGWDADGQTTSDGTATVLSEPTLGDLSAKAIAKVLGSRSFDATTCAELTTTQAQDLAKARLFRASLDAVSGSCTFTGSSKCGPGDMIEIADTSTRFSGKAFVSGVTHMIEAGTWTTTVRMGLPLDWVSDKPDLGGPGASGIATPMSGLHIGKVIQIHEDPNDQHRILISLPAIGAPDVQVWARMGTPYATATGGIQFLPETDDEVLVGFLNDDPNAPVILGALQMPSVDRPAEVREENYIKKIMTKGQLAITFDDEKTILTVTTPGGHTITLDDDGKEMVLKDSSGSTVTLDETGIKMTTEGDFTVDAKGNVNIAATGDATMSGVNVTCEADAGFTGKGGAQAEVSAGGQTIVKGGIVLIN